MGGDVATAPMSPSSPARAALINLALRPAEGLAAWQGAAVEPDATENVWRLDCPGPQEEALSVALVLRQALETPGRTAALVTPDRGLARRVAKLLPIALRLREVKSSALRLLWRDLGGAGSAVLTPQSASAPPDVQGPAVETEQLKLPLLLRKESFSASPNPSPQSVFRRDEAGSPDDPFGPLVLKDLTDAYGLLVLHSEGEPVPDGWCIDQNSLWLPGTSLLALVSADDSGDAPVEAALEALREGASVLPELRPWLNASPRRRLLQQRRRRSRPLQPVSLPPRTSP